MSIYTAAAGDAAASAATHGNKQSSQQTFNPNLFRFYSFICFAAQIWYCNCVCPIYGTFIPPKKTT